MTIPGTITTASTVGFALVLVAQEAITPPGSRMDPTLFAAAIVTVIAALGGMIVQVINSVSAARDRREAAAERKALLERTNATAAKADTLVVTTAEIRELTNSTNSNLQKALEVMTEKLAGSERALAQAQETRRTVAATQAVTDIKHAMASPVVPHTAPLPAQTPTTTVAVDEALKKLEKIEDHTGDTAKNTARTNATVNELKKDQ